MKRTGYAVVLSMLVAAMWFGRGGQSGGQGPGVGGDPGSCADVNGDGELDLSDAVTILNYLFTGQGAPPVCIAQGVSFQDLVGRVAELERDVSVRVFNSGCPAFGSTSAVPFDSERWDTNDIHDNLTNNTRLTAPISGKYLIHAHVNWQEDPAGVRQIFIRLNGVTSIARQSSDGRSRGETDENLATHYSLAAGDYVELMASVDSSNVLPLHISSNANSSPEFGMIMVSP